MKEQYAETANELENTKAVLKETEKKRQNLCREYKALKDEVFDNTVVLLYK